jgi:hypothetical protein
MRSMNATFPFLSNCSLLPLNIYCHYLCLSSYVTACVCSVSVSVSVSVRLELYEKYKGFTLEGLKDFMRWNKQPIAGTKVRETDTERERQRDRERHSEGGREGERRYLSLSLSLSA